MNGTLKRYFEAVVAGAWVGIVCWDVDDLTEIRREINNEVLITPITQRRVTARDIYVGTGRFTFIVVKSGDIEHMVNSMELNAVYFHDPNGRISDEDRLRCKVRVRREPFLHHFDSLFG